jgi:hypothetical protein
MCKVPLLIQQIQSNDFIREIWQPRPLISAGAYNRDLAIRAAETGDLIAFGRAYIPNVSSIFSNKMPFPR